jgi:hypothetical protein
MGGEALLTSGRTPGTLWQQYRIHDDHLELDTMFGRWTIPFADVEHAEVAEPALRSLLHLRFDPVLRGIKLDFADFVDHVSLDVRRGPLRRILFTPDDPVEFVRVLDAALARWRRASQGR